MADTLQEAIQKAIAEEAAGEAAHSFINSDLTREVFDDVEARGAHAIVRVWAGKVCLEWRSDQPTPDTCPVEELYEMKREPIPEGYYPWANMALPPGEYPISVPTPSLIELVHLELALSDLRVSDEQVIDDLERMFPEGRAFWSVEGRYEVYANVPRYERRTMNGPALGAADVPEKGAGVPLKQLIPEHALRRVETIINRYNQGQLDQMSALKAFLTVLEPLRADLERRDQLPENIAIWLLTIAPQYPRQPGEDYEKFFPDPGTPGGRSGLGEAGHASIGVIPRGFRGYPLPRKELLPILTEYAARRICGWDAVHQIEKLLEPYRAEIEKRGDTLRDVSTGLLQIASFDPHLPDRWRFEEFFPKGD